MRKRTGALGLCVGAAFLFPALATAAVSSGKDAPKITLSTSYNYLTGKYGQAQSTDITYIPAVMKIQQNRWTAELTVPYIRIDGPGVVVGGGAPVVVGGAGTKKVESGLGDILGSLGYTFPVNNRGTFLNLKGEVKFPTASSSKRLGTGNTDFTLSTGVTQVYHNAYFIATGKRRFNGSSTAYPLHDVWGFSLGGGYKFTSDVSAGVKYDFSQAATTGSNDASQAIGYVDYKLTTNVSTLLYAGGGFTNASPSFITGLQLSYKFDADTFFNGFGME